MSEVSTDKTERKRPYYHRYLFRNLLCHQLCLHASWRYSPCSLDADAWLYRCVCRHSLYADGRKGSKPGAVFLMGLITALIYFATGQFTLVILISMASTCILAEVVRMVTKYNSFKGNSIAYVIFLWGWLVLPFPSGCLRPISWHRLQNRECPLIMLRQLKLCHPMQC